MNTAASSPRIASDRPSGRLANRRSSMQEEALSARYEKCALLVERDWQVKPIKKVVSRSFLAVVLDLKNYKTHNVLVKEK